MRRRLILWLTGLAVVIWLTAAGLAEAVMRPRSATCSTAR